MSSLPDHPIVQVAIPVPLPAVFDYRVPRKTGPIPRGTRVLAPFGQRNLVGIVTGSSVDSQVPESRLLEISRILDDCEPLLNSALMDLLDWCCQYYKHAPGEIFANAIPPALRRADGKLPPPLSQYVLTPAGGDRLDEPPGRAKQQFAMLEKLKSGPASAEDLQGLSKGWKALLKKLLEQDWVGEEPAIAPAPGDFQGPKLNDEQQLVVDSISSCLNRYSCHLLDGVTGSGKTEIYLHLIHQVISSGRQVLVLVPEIGLTPQLLRRFSERLGIEPAVYHSGLSSGKRLAGWSAVRNGQD
jgi:primosomal protein N' (replication factor Y)